MRDENVPETVKCMFKQNPGRLSGGADVLSGEEGMSDTTA